MRNSSDMNKQIRKSRQPFMQTMYQMSGKTDQSTSKLRLDFIMFEKCQPQSE